MLPNGLHELDKMRIATGAYWPYLGDADFEVQRTLDIREYTDPPSRRHRPHTVILEPDLAIEKIYVGYWFFAVLGLRPVGRPARAERQDPPRLRPHIARGPSGVGGHQHRLMRP